MNEQTYELLRRITVVNYPQFATELKVMLFDDVYALLNVSTAKSVLLKALEPEVDYITIGDTTVLPLATVIAMVHSSRMPNKANVKFALMQELYSNTVIQTGVILNAVENQLAKVFDAYINNSAKAEELLGSGFQKTFHAVYNTLNYATVEDTIDAVNDMDTEVQPQQEEPENEQNDTTTTE